MEFLREFIKAGYLKAVGKMEDYRVILGASAYFDKGILKEEDLKEISEAIDKRYEEKTLDILDQTEIIENTDEIVKDMNDITEEKAEE